MVTASYSSFLGTWGEMTGRGKDYIFNHVAHILAL